MSDKECPKCSGYKLLPITTPYGEDEVYCDHCNGEGVSPYSENTCDHCNGEGIS